MEKRKELFTNKDLKKLIIPLIIEQLLTVTVGLADSIMISSVGEAAAKSPSSAWITTRVDESISPVS